MSPQSLLGHAENVMLLTLAILVHREKFDINMHLKYDMLRGPTS